MFFLVVKDHLRSIYFCGLSGNNQILIGVSVVAPYGESSKITLKLPHDAYPENVIAETIRLRVRTFSMSPEQRQQCVQQHLMTYILKVCGCEELLLGDYPLSQYKVVLAIDFNSRVLF